MKHLEGFSFFKKKDTKTSVEKLYKIFENESINNILIDCLIYIFDKYNIPENKDGNTFSWWSNKETRVAPVISICSIPDRRTTEDILEDIMKEKKTIERRIKRKIKVEIGYDYPMYLGGWIEVYIKR